jgi:hypothetical protein
MLLLKLIHAMKNRPDFGTSYDNNPDGPIQLWISQVKALVDRVGISRGSEFRAAVTTAVRYWTHSVRSMQIIANDAIEELRLELELYQDEEIGQVYDGQESHRFKTDILKVVSSAQTEVFTIDPYLDAAIFALLFENNASFSIRAFCSNYFAAVKAYAESFALQHSRKVEVKRSKRLHDRVIFVDDDCWLVGASLKDAGIKPTYLMPLNPALSLEKKRIYDGLWSQA